MPHDYRKDSMPKAIRAKEEVNEDSGIEEKDVGELDASVTGLALSSLWSWSLPGWKAVGAAILTDALSAAISAGISDMLAPDKPSIGSGDFERSRTYGFDNVGTSFDPLGESIPIIYGTLKQGGKRVQSFTTQEGEKQYLHMLLLIGEGQIEDIRNIKIEGQPVDNYQNVELYKRYGTPDQEAIPGLQDQVIQHQVQQQLTDDGTYRTYTTQGEVDRVSLGIYYNSGLYDRNDNGDLKSTKVTHEIQYRPINEDGERGEWSDPIQVTDRNRKQATIRREHPVNLPEKGFYDIRVKRITDEFSGEDLGRNASTFQFIKEVVDDNLRYPNLALLGLKIQASEQLSGSEPEVSFVVDGKILNSNKFPDSLLSEDKFSRNPYLCVYDLFTTEQARGGAGLDTSQLLGRDQRYLPDWINARDFANDMVPDGEGGEHKRHRFDIAIDQDFRVPDFLGHVNSVLNGFFLPVGDEIKPVVNDEDEKEFVQMFAEGKNIEEDSLNFQYVGVDQRYNSIDGEILDEDEKYEKTRLVIPREDEFTGEQLFPQSSVNMASITRKAEAFRLGLRKLIEAHEETKIVQLKTTLDSIKVEPGDLAKVAHSIPDMEWSMVNGTLDGYNDFYWVIDQEIYLEEDEIYDIGIMFKDGKYRELAVSGQSQGKDTSVIETVTDPQEIDSEPVENAQYAIGKQTEVSKTMRVLSIDKTSKNTGQVTGIVHYPEKYQQAQDFSIADGQIDILDSEIPPEPVEDLELTEEVIRKDGQYQSNLHINWTPPEQPNVSHYNIYWDEDFEGEALWDHDGSTEGDRYVLNDVPVGETIKVAVQTVTNEGNNLPIKECPKDIIEPEGKVENPPDITGFSVEFRNLDILLDWDEVEIVDLKHYEIRKGNSWSDSSLISKVDATRHVLDKLADGSHTFFIKAVDVVGNKSDNAIEASIDVNVNKPKNLNYKFNDENFRVFWDEPETDFDVYKYEIVRGPDKELIARTESLEYEQKADWAGTEQWFVRTIDIAGNYSDYAQIDVEIQNPQADNLTINNVKHDILFQWDNIPGTLPIDHCEIYRGEDLSLAERIGTSDTSFSTIIEPVRGRYRYWIVPIDTAGNSGASDSLRVSVSPPPGFQLYVDRTQNFRNPALMFDGSDYVEIDHDSVHEQATFSLGARFIAYGGSLDSGSYDIVNKGSNGEGFKITINSNNKIEFSIGIGNGNYETVSFNDKIIDRKEYFVWGQFNGTDLELWKMVRDLEEPVKVDSKTVSISYVSSTEKLYIGDNVEGVIDDVQYWTEFYTNAQRILDSFNGSVDYEADNLYGYWPSDEPFGDRLKDVSQLGLIGSVSGATWTAFHDERQNSTLTNKISINRNKQLIAPVGDGISWNEHFESNGWNSFQDKIDDGYDKYLQPASGTGVFNEVMDAGALLPNCTIGVSLEEEVLAGSPNRKVEIGVKSGIEDSWDFQEGVSRTADGFRFVQTRVTVSGTRDDLLTINRVNTSAAVSTNSDNYTVEVFASDNGTTFEFRDDYLDVVSLNATPKTSDSYHAVVDYSDDPKPQDFTVWLYDSNGNLVDGKATVYVEGFLLPD